MKSASEILSDVEYNK